ncbi:MULTISPECIES: hypothetical protein [unclassified Frankia]
MTCTIDGVWLAAKEVSAMGLHLSQIAEEDDLLTSDPLALLIGMVLDQRMSERTSGTGGSMPV